MRRIFAALTVMALAIPCVLAQDKPLDGDLKKLQGKWSTKAGPDSANVTLILETGKISFVIPAPTGEEKTIAGTFTIDEKAEPKVITWSGMKVDDRPLPDVEGIYTFDGEDTLKIAGGSGKERPKAFVEKGKESEGARANTMVFTRVKDEPKK